MEGLIYKIDKYSTQNGPGFRTVVYMKGSSLNIPWGEHPEALSKNIEMLYDKEKCNMCYKCIEACNERMLAEEENRVFECTKCGKCVDACPMGARKLIGEKISAEELIERIIPEIQYYKASGGGVTFAGGEPMLQEEFLLEVIKKLKEKDINVAVSTSGFIDYKIMEKFIPYVDYFIYHFNLVNKKIHEKYTGQSNEIIIENLKKVCFMSKVIISITFINEVNCNMNELKQIVGFMSKLELYGIVIKGYSNKNEYMYRLLGKEQKYTFHRPEKKTLTNIGNLFSRLCDNIQVIS